MSTMTKQTEPTIIPVDDGSGDSKEIVLHGILEGKVVVRQRHWDDRPWQEITITGTQGIKLARKLAKDVLAYNALNNGELSERMRAVKSVDVINKEWPTEDRLAAVQLVTERKRLDASIKRTERALDKHLGTLSDLADYSANWPAMLEHDAAAEIMDRAGITG